MKKGTYFLLSLASFILCLLQWSPWAPWPVPQEDPVARETALAEVPATEAPAQGAKADTPKVPAAEEAAGKKPSGGEEAKKAPWKPAFAYLGADTHWLGIEQHFWTSFLAGFAITFLAAAVFSADDEEDDEDDEDF